MKSTALRQILSQGNKTKARGESHSALGGNNIAAAVATSVKELAWDHKVPGSNPGSCSGRKPL